MMHWDGEGQIWGSSEREKGENLSFFRNFRVGDLQIHDALVRAGAKIGVSGTGKG